MYAPDDSLLLVSYAELVRAAQQSLKTNDEGEVRQALADAQDRLEGFLHRRLLVHRVESRLDLLALATAREFLPTVDGLVPAYHADDWPVVQVLPTGDEGGDAPSTDADGRLLYVPTDAFDDLDAGAAQVVPYFAGYRGRHHVLTADDVPLDENGYPEAGWVALDELEDMEVLAVLPPPLPERARRTIVELTLLYLNAARSGTLGRGRRTVQVGAGAVTVDAVDTMAEARALQRCATMQRRDV